MPARPGILREQGSCERDSDLGDRDVEVQPQQSVGQQSAETGNLVEAGVERCELRFQSMLVHSAPRE